MTNLHGKLDAIFVYEKVETEVWLNIGSYLSLAGYPEQEPLSDDPVYAIWRPDWYILHCDVMIPKGSFVDIAKSSFMLMFVIYLRTFNVEDIDLHHILSPLTLKHDNFFVDARFADLQLQFLLERLFGKIHTLGLKPISNLDAEISAHVISHFLLVEISEFTGNRYLCCCFELGLGAFMNIGTVLTCFELHGPPWKLLIHFVLPVKNIFYDVKQINC